MSEEKMRSKKRKEKKPELSLLSITRDWAGFFEIDARIGERSYTFYLDSEFLVRKVKSLVKKRSFGLAISLLRENNKRGDRRNGEANDSVR